MLGFEGGSPYMIVGRGLDLPTQNSEEPSLLNACTEVLLRLRLVTDFQTSEEFIYQPPMQHYQQIKRVAR